MTQWVTSTRSQQVAYLYHRDGMGKALTNSSSLTLVQTEITFFSTAQLSDELFHSSRTTCGTGGTFFVKVRGVNNGIVSDDCAFALNDITRMKNVVSEKQKHAS